jgi:hypothetical protein
MDNVFNRRERTLFYVVSPYGIRLASSMKHVYFISTCGTRIARQELWESKSPKDLSADW